MKKALQILFLVIAVVSFFFSGCATKSSSTQQADLSDWEWISSARVVDDKTGQYRDCSYDNASDGYLCPPGTK